MNGKQPFWPEGLREHIKLAAQKAGIKKRVGWHTFRHSFGMMLVANGVHVKIAQELMRHQNVRMTLEMYSQAPEDQKREAQSKIVHTIRHKGRLYRKNRLRKHRPNPWSDET